MNDNRALAIENVIGTNNKLTKVADGRFKNGNAVQYVMANNISNEQKEWLRKNNYVVVDHEYREGVVDSMIIDASVPVSANTAHRIANFIHQDDYSYSKIALDTPDYLQFKVTPEVWKVFIDLHMNFGLSQDSQDFVISKLPEEKEPAVSKNKLTQLFQKTKGQLRDTFNYFKAKITGKDERQTNEAER